MFDLREESFGAHVSTSEQGCHGLTCWFLHHCPQPASTVPTSGHVQSISAQSYSTFGIDVGIKEY
jgi:hypothetical protein